MSVHMTPADVSAVICTMNSIESIQACLASVRAAGVGEIIVVDALSTDGTREVAESLADLVLTDPGTGLGNARNVGIAMTTKSLILNMGSDNVMPPHQLEVMISTLVDGNYAGVSARTVIEGNDYVSRGLNAWRTGRFIPGPAAVIGTPTLFRGQMLRDNPYDPTRRFSDDSELCERWAKDFSAKFAISQAFVQEIGKTTWPEVRIRARMYGVSDSEVFRSGRASGWSTGRKISSLTYPARMDFLRPLTILPIVESIVSAPFLAAFTTLRYAAWAKTSLSRGIG